jgi:hypothetical protein
MRPVSPIFSTSNVGGPFAPIIVGNSFRMSYDSFLFADGTDLASATRLSMPANIITESVKVYLKLTFNNGGIQEVKVISDDKWWQDYPQTISYSGSSKKIKDQTALYAPIFSVTKNQKVQGKFVNTNSGELIVYRHMYNNVMVMQSCKYFFLLPAPFAPEP